MMTKDDDSLLRTELLAVAYWNNQERGQAADLLNRLQEGRQKSSSTRSVPNALLAAAETRGEVAPLLRKLAEQEPQHLE